MNETKNCQNCKKDFIVEPDDFLFYEKMKVPVPNVCPDCRFKMKAMWRNENTLYSGQKCDMCEKNYKITEQELLFYRKMSLPIPRQCFYCRHHDRILRRGPYKFWNRKCDHCGKEIETNYSPDRKEIVYCEQCYQQEVI